MIRIAFDPGSKRWTFYESHPTDSRDESELDLDYIYNTVEDATVGAISNLGPQPDGTSTIWIYKGVEVPNMPSNVRIIGSPGYRRRIDGGLYDLDLTQLQEVHSQTIREDDLQARNAATEFDIPLGQQVHAFSTKWLNMPRRSRPKLNEFLDEMMPNVAKRRRQRHMRTFMIVASEDWPLIVATTTVKITGMESILRAAREYSKKPKPPRKKTPLKERYSTLSGAVRAERYDEAKRLVLKFDEEDAGLSEGALADDEQQ